MNEILSQEKRPAGDPHRKGFGVDKRNALTFPLLFRLTNRLLELKADIEGRKYTWEKLVAEMTRELGHPVTVPNLKTALEAAGVTMQIIRISKKTGGPPRPSRLLKVEHGLRALTSRCEERAARGCRLEQTVAALAARLMTLEQQLRLTPLEQQPGTTQGQG